jgi:uncharacterized protein
MHNMPRPFKQKRVFCNPTADFFKPANIPLRELEQVELSLEELEALRLDSLLGLNQQMAAEKMGIHQSTFARTAARARQKVADALIHSKSILINRGDKMPGGDKTGPQGRGPRTGRGMGNCPPNQQDQNQAPIAGRSMGRGFGRMRGMGRGRRFD